VLGAGAGQLVGDRLTRAHYLALDRAVLTAPAGVASLAEAELAAILDGDRSPARAARIATASDSQQAA